ncbi:MAG: ATP-binding protein [Betaproteobacteria bacterium]
MSQIKVFPESAFLEGGGELGALMRAYDWSATPLGPPDAWPRSLKTAVRIMLTSRQPIWLGWGTELTYLYNDAYKSIIGGKHPAALGRPFSEVWKEIWDVVGPMSEAVMIRDEGTYVESQLLIMERHGYQEETYYTFSYSPVPNDEGGPGGLICANSEDTRRVIGERQLALLSELAGRTGSARKWLDACALAMESLQSNPRDIPFALIFMTDDAGTALNAAASSTGADALRHAGMWPCGEVMRTGQLQLLVLGAAHGELPKGAWPRVPSHAAILPIEPSGSSGRGGALVVGLNPFRQFDESYRDFLKLVARQVAAAIANAQAYEEEKKRVEVLAEIDRAKTAFFSNVSHEFRTPLTLMLGPIDDILAKPEGGVYPESRALLDVVQRNGRRLLKLVNTLLDFARIEAGRTQAAFEETDLSSLTAELASNFRSACERAGIGLRVQCPALAERVFVDREMWEKVVLNLLSNAFKFTLKGEIGIVVRDAEKCIEVEVSDTGTGIPPESLPRMFERFHRVEGARGRSHEGSGIGLALVQELVRLHGGEIRVASTFGAGTTFTVSLPRGSAHLPPGQVKKSRASYSNELRADAYVEEVLSWLPDVAPEGAKTVSQAVHRVLLADDNADLREYARRLLAEHYEVEAVEDGAAALAAARHTRPDIIVSDVMMPQLDGFGLIRELRADPMLRAITVILLSARAGEEARLEGLGRGADDYLVKPFSSRELLIRVGALVRSADAHRKASEALVQFETLLNQAPVGVYLVDQAFRVAEVNPVARPVFGDIPDLIGRDFDEVARILWPRAYADELVGHFRHTLETGEPHVVPEHIEERQDRKVTEIYEWQIHRIPLPGARMGVVCYFRDISKSVMAREALRESDRRKDEFLATLSHELRNPLAPLRNSLQLLRISDNRDTALAPVQAIMERQVNHLVRLVDDLLEMSRISRGTFELRRERVDLATIVRNAVETSNPLIQAANHRLTLSLPDAPVWLDGDPVRLAQIVSNLLNNAATYTDHGGSIAVDARQIGGAAILSVRDNGPGIAAADMKNIFEMFSRGERSTTRGQGGLGIGLALARKLAEMHGGSIDVASEGPGRGSEFTVKIPATPIQPAANASSSSGAATGMADKRILVVDDNVDAGDSLAMILTLFGAEVRVARNGPEALEVFREFAATVVLLDIGMPGMDGYEVARRMRDEFSGRRTALVALTGWGQEEDRRKAREAGFDHHLVKPVEISELQALLASIQSSRP